MHKVLLTLVSLGLFVSLTGCAGSKLDRPIPDPARTPAAPVVSPLPDIDPAPPPVDPAVPGVIPATKPEVFG